MSYNRWMPPECSTELYHHGVKGMKWGVRRYQPYSDGSYGKYGEKLQKAVSLAERSYSQVKKHGGTDSAYTFKSIDTRVGVRNKNGKTWTTVSTFDPERRKRS